MKIPKDLRHRFFCEGTDVHCRHIRTIISAMQNWFVLEFIYRENGEEVYLMASPVCLKHEGGKWQLLGFDHEGRPQAYDIDRIASIGEHWETFSLPVNFNFQRFAAEHSTVVFGVILY